MGNALNHGLIAREVIFGNPEKSGARVSPDGKRLAYLAPHDGTMSVWTRTLGAQDDVMIAHDPARPIPWATWQGDSAHVLYLQDKGGNENYHLFQADLTGSGVREITPGDNVRCIPLALDPNFPSEALVTLNERDPALFDVHRVDLRTAAVALDTENPGDVLAWCADNAYVVRAALARTPDGATLIRVRDDAGSPWRPLDRIESSDFNPRLVSFSRDNAALYAISAKDADTSRLVKYDLAKGTYAVVFEDPQYDVNSGSLIGDPETDVKAVFVDPASKEPAAVAVMRERLTWHVLDERFEAAFAALAQLHDGDFTIEGASADGMTLIVRYTFDAGPNRYYAFNRQSGEATFLFVDRPALLDYTLAPMRSIAFTARDGLRIHGYLTLPVGIEPKNLPTVLYVHGGPWHRDCWGYEDIVQWLSNRGYAVLQVNFRGSRGYGKRFLNAANRQWAGAMRTDLLDARDWAIGQGFADPLRFGIFGASYGGYAVLTALAFTPDAFTCGVDIVGPSNLNTLLASIPPYWGPVRKVFDERMGEDAAFLDSQSPIFKASEIRAPLLIGQGANDPRVKQQESDQIVEALRANGIPVTYLVFEDEGHGFVKPENAKRFTALAETFLARTLGGKLLPPQPEEDFEPFLRANG
jgi:dipeptidyl aminopeptidase/acylaminoacyl peptidase